MYDQSTEPTPAGGFVVVLTGAELADPALFNARMYESFFRQLWAADRERFVLWLALYHLRGLEPTMTDVAAITEHPFRAAVIGGAIRHYVALSDRRKSDPDAAALLLEVGAAVATFAAGRFKPDVARFVLRRIARATGCNGARP